MKKLAIIIIVALIIALTATTVILAAESNTRSDETIARVDRLIASYED